MSDISIFIRLAWKNIWKQNTIWLFSALSVVPQLFQFFPAKSDSIPLFSLLAFLESFISIFLWFASSIGVPYLAYCFSIGKSVTIRETLSVIKKLFGRVFRLSCLGILILFPCLFLVVLFSTRNPNFPANLSNNISLAFLPLSLFSAIFHFSIAGFFANDLGILKSIKEAWALYTDHIKILASIGVILAGIYKIITAIVGGLTVLIQSGFNTTSLNNLNFINPYASLSSNTLFLLIDAVIQIIWFPFAVSVFILAYLKFSGTRIHS